MTTDTRPYDYRADVTLAVVVEERIRILWRERSWWREHRYADWPTMRAEDYHELRALVRLARTARRLRAARPDRVTLGARSFHDWQAR